MRSASQRRAHGTRDRVKVGLSDVHERGQSGERATSQGDFCEDRTRRMMAELEDGRVPRVQPWGTIGRADAGVPQNVLTGRRRSGINILILGRGVRAPLSSPA